ncbi:MAG: hypothetical protein A2X35_06955 [Elusimicrobia bacterium GWA2_61_42]|nr:MAG: hypothetical protein A2X35_06955 [Elusimicrobia bacterium GWA2_61_42]OGR78364.1 MAG: hypothetical protein A2X38_05610 [Elusimicrobia bacterium GWC2_61_25]
MKIRSANWFLSVGFVAALLAAGCTLRDEKTIGTPANPLVVVLSPAHVPSMDSGAADFIKKHLEAATAMSVEIRAAISPSDTIKKFDSGLTDAGLVTLEEYLVAREEYRVRAALQVLRGSKLGDYEGVLLTRTPGGAGSVAELSGRKVGFVGPYSLSGFTLPSIYLKNAGVEVEKEFSATHEGNLQKLLKGEVAAVATYARQASRAPGLKILAVTGKVPNEPLIVRRNLEAATRDRLIAGFLTLGDTKEGRRALAAVADITGFRAADEKVYQPVHELLLGEGKTVYDLVPDGWYIYRLNQPYYPD